MHVVEVLQEKHAEQGECMRAVTLFSCPRKAMWVAGPETHPAESRNRL